MRLQRPPTAPALTKAKRDRTSLGTVWRSKVRRTGEDTPAAIEQESGPTGVHSGRFDGLQFALNHFDGRHAPILEIVVRKDGGLDSILKQPRESEKKYRAARAG